MCVYVCVEKERKRDYKFIIAGYLYHDTESVNNLFNMLRIGKYISFSFL